MQNAQPPIQDATRSHTIWFSATIFTSAFLLFQVQPLIGKFILPWYGGSPAVWTTCMLVFQVLLFAGYSYAHALTSWLTLRRQALLHSVLLVIAAVVMPITPSADWKPTGNESPTLSIVILLLRTVGIPYFLLSSTGPLLQRWFCFACPGKLPYRLYALSNVGSLLALLSYPFLFEPIFSSSVQAWLWSVVFCCFAMICLVCAGRLLRSDISDPSRKAKTTTGRFSRTTWLQQLLQLVLFSRPTVRDAVGNDESSLHGYCRNPLPVDCSADHLLIVVHRHI